MSYNLSAPVITLNPTTLPLWLRSLVVAGAFLIAIGLCLLAYRAYTKPVTLRIGVGSVDGEIAKGAVLIANRFAKVNAPVRLNVVKFANILEATSAFSVGKVDLAVVRADVGDLSNARAVALVAEGVAMVVAPSGSTLTSIESLKGHTVGVVGGDINRQLVKALSREYGLDGNVVFKDLTPSNARQAVQSKSVDALLLVVPLTKRYLTYVKSLFNNGSNGSPLVIPIDSAGAIADSSGSFESTAIPKGTLRGAPPNPPDDLTTLKTGFYLVANSKLSSDAVTNLTEALVNARENLGPEHSILSGITEPDTDPDAVIPVHPGAAVYYNDAQQSFMDKYGDDIYLTPMVFGFLVTVFAAAWKFLGFGKSDAPNVTLHALYHLPRQIKTAESEVELSRIEAEFDDILKAEATKTLRGDERAVDIPTLTLTAHRLDNLIHYQRKMIARESPDSQLGKRYSSPVKGERPDAASNTGSDK